MRIEGFVSLIGCVMFLFVLSFGLAALAREVRVMLPDSGQVAASSTAAEQRSVAQAEPRRERRRSH